MSILELGIEDLRQGVLAAGFAAGAVAAVVRWDARLPALWAGLVEDRRERLPWEAPLIDIARNHYGSSDITASLGDLYYFQPGQHGYIARKMELQRSPGTVHCTPRPTCFAQGEEHYATDQATLDACCDIADLLLLALTPADRTVPAVRISLQRLKYQHRTADFGDLARLTVNSLGRWGRVGAAIDRHRAAGALDGKGASDLLGMAMLVPGVSRVARSINTAIVRSRPQARLKEGDMVVERAHLDERHFTALAGRRETIRTEVFADGAWRELPIGLNALTVFPGNLAARSLGLKPTLHRVLYAGNAAPGPVDPRAGNVTLLIGAS